MNSYILYLGIKEYMHQKYVNYCSFYISRILSNSVIITLNLLLGVYTKYNLPLNLNDRGWGDMKSKI